MKILLENKAKGSSCNLCDEHSGRVVECTVYRLPECTHTCHYARVMDRYSNWVDRKLKQVVDNG